MSNSIDEKPLPGPPGPPKGFSWLQILIIFIVLMLLGVWFLAANRPTTSPEPAVRADMARELASQGYSVSPWAGRKGPMYIVVPRAKVSLTKMQASELAQFISKKLKGAGVDSDVYIRTPQGQTIAVAK
ncbi:MAG: hypothetical protein QM758_10910 [Armatimonas sp.]